MTKVSFEISDSDHERLVRLAEGEGKSVSEFVLDRLMVALTERSEANDLRQLEAILDSRLRQAQSSEASERRVSDVFSDARLKTDG